MQESQVRDGSGRKDGVDEDGRGERGWDAILEAAGGVSEGISLQKEQEHYF